jgi:hypothetical protein
VAATESDFTGIDADGVDAYLGDEWPGLARAVQSLALYFLAKVANGTEPTDVLNGIMFGLAGQSTNHKDWRIVADASNNLVIEENTGTDASPVWATRLTINNTAFVVPTHASRHQNGGADEVAVAAAAANAIPKAGAGGTLADAWIALSNITQHLASIDHDGLLNFVANEHIDWTADQGATNIPKANVPSAGDADTLGSVAAAAYSLIDGTRAFTGTVGGVTPVADADLATKAYVDAGRVYAAETAARNISASETDFIQVTGLTLSPAPDGSRKYRVNLHAEAGASTSTDRVEVRLYAGTNGTKADTLIATFAGSSFNGAALVYSVASVAGFEWTPLAGETKVGLAHWANSAVAGAFLQDRVWLEVVEIIE